MKQLLFKILRFSGIPFLLRELIQESKVSIIILHDPDKDTIDNCFKYWKKHYNIISLNEFIEALEKGSSSKLPRKSMVITFDDGHIGNYSILDKIKEYNIPLTIFICSSIVGTNRGFWFNQDISFSERRKLKLMSNEERLKYLSSIGFSQNSNLNSPTALQHTHINEMKEFVNFQSHGRFHPIFTQCSFEEVSNEILESKEELEMKFNLEVNALAYPNGDYSLREMEIAKKGGYKCALTIDGGYSDLDQNPFKLKRLGISDSANLDEIVVKSSGLWSYMEKIKFWFYK